MFFLKLRYYLIVVAGILLVGGVGIVHAAPVGLTIRPVKVFYTLDPGESIRDSISLSNPNDSPVIVETSVEDFTPVAGGSGINFDFVGRAKGVTTVRDWITQDFTNFRLEGTQEKEMPFTIRVPKDAEPGSHFGILFFKANALTEGGGQLKIGTRVGVLVYVIVTGDYIQSGKVHGFSGPKFAQKGPLTFAIDFENTGTVHFEPTGAITITNIFGKKVADLAVGGSMILPTGRQNIAVNWPTKRFFLGVYKAQVEVKDGEGNILTFKSYRFFGFPIFYILGLFAVLAGVYFGFKFIKNKVNFSISLKK